MSETGISIQKIAYTLIILVILVYLVIIGKAILAPICFAGLFALLLTPLCNYFESKIGYRVLSILITFIVAILPITVLMVIFALQFIEIVKDIASLREDLVQRFILQINAVGEQLGLQVPDGKDWLVENLSGMINTPISFVLDSLGTSTYILTGGVLTVIFTYLILLYRSSVKQFFKIQFSPQTRHNAAETLNQIQELTQSYLSGIIVVMSILAVCNSLGLLLIGIEYAVFWGCLAAFLALVPYIGTFLGGSLPLLFALTTTTTIWQPLAVIVLFSLIQFIEGNIITPKIVGKSVSINPLLAIIALFIGGMIWGVSGLVLAIPVFGVINAILATIDPLKPLSLIFSNRISEGETEFVEKYDHDQYRLSQLFRNDPSESNHD